MSLQKGNTPLSITSRRLGLILQGRKMIVSKQKRVKLHLFCRMSSKINQRKRKRARSIKDLESAWSTNDRENMRDY